MGGHFWAHIAVWTFLCSVRSACADRGLLEDLGLDALPDVTKVRIPAGKPRLPENPKRQTETGESAALPVSPAASTASPARNVKIETRAVGQRVPVFILSFPDAHIRISACVSIHPLSHKIVRCHLLLTACFFPR